MPNTNLSSNNDSVMAVASRNGVDVVANDVSGRQTPSAIFFAGDHRLIGEHSTGHAGSNPRNLVNRVKDLLEDRRSSSALPPSSLPLSSSSKPLKFAGAVRGTGDSAMAGATAVKGSIGRERDEDEGGNKASDVVARGEDAEAAGAEEDEDVPPSEMGAGEEGDGGDAFFCETRSPEDADHAGRVAIVKHLGEQLELSASETIAYLLGHCSEVVGREGGGRAAEAGGAGAGVGVGERASAVSSCVVASVPSHFTLRQRRAILDAASIAGVPMPMVRDLLSW